jgi:hypothetical protein
MRLTILAGLIMGAALAINSSVGAHSRAKVSRAASAVRVHVHAVAPWYIALNKGGRRAGGFAGARGALAAAQNLS